MQDGLIIGCEEESFPSCVRADFDHGAFFRKTLRLNQKPVDYRFITQKATKMYMKRGKPQYKLGKTGLPGNEYQGACYLCWEE